MKNLFSSRKLFVFLIIVSIFVAIGVVLAATNISSTYPNYFAWNDVIGWMDFYTPNTIQVQTHMVLGYASSSAGDISLDCATTRNGDICSNRTAGNTYYVINDGCGNLSGWGWNDNYGWISFHGKPGGSQPTDPQGIASTSIAYGVRIDSGTGDFSGWAWNDIAGWIDFNCSNIEQSICGSPATFRVNTSWRASVTTGTLDSAIFDTSSTNAQYNSIMWNGNLLPGSSCSGITSPVVLFQFAASNNTSSLVFTGPGGVGDTAGYYPASGAALPGTTYALGYHHKGRYFKYRVFLQSDSGQSVSPRVDDVIVNWSP